MNDNQNIFFEVLQDYSYGMFPAPLPAQKAIYVLEDYLLGEDYYIVSPLSNGQANTIIVDAILMKYSRKYRKDKKRLEKFLKKRRRMQNE